ncbi:MAG: MFS transporter [Atopobiaceae bacterium]|nr:MFS transporter [Atopobiaceae bacterium]
MSLIASTRSSLRALTPAERRLVIARFCQRMAGDSSYFIGILGLATYTLAADATQVSMLMLVLNTMVVVGNLAGGVIVDRIGPRRCALAALALGVVVAVGIQFVEPSFAMILVVAVFLGGAVGLQETAFRSFPPYLVEGEDKLHRTNGLVELATNVSVVAGPAIGGLITMFLPVVRVFLFYIVASVAAMAVISGVHERYQPVVQEEEGEPGNGHFMADLVEGVRVTFSSSFLRTLFVMGFLGYFAFGAFDSLESLYYRDVLCVSADWMGWLTAVMGVGCVVVSLVMLRLPERALSLRSVVVALFVVGTGCMLYVGTPWLACAVAGQAICGLGFGVLEPLQLTLVQRDTSLTHMGRVMATMRTGFQGAGILPLLVAPSLADAFGVQAVLLGASTFVACVAVGFGAWLWARGRWS